MKKEHILAIVSILTCLYIVTLHVRLHNETNETKEMVAMAKSLADKYEICSELLAEERLYNLMLEELMFSKELNDKELNNRHNEINKSKEEYKEIHM